MKGLPPALLSVASLDHTPEKPTKIESVNCICLNCVTYPEKPTIQMVVVREFTLFNLDCGRVMKYVCFSEIPPDRSEFTELDMFQKDLRTWPVTERRKTLEPPVSIVLW